MLSVSQSDSTVAAVRSSHAGVVVDAAVEQWLRDSVVPVCDDVVAGKGTFLSADEVVSLLDSASAGRQ